jgi:hypothetical protein
MVADTTKKLSDSIKKNLEKGYDEESLKWALIKQGYSRTIIEIAIKNAKEQINSNSEAKIISDKPFIKHEIYDEEDNLIKSFTHKKKSWWQKIFDFD